MASWKKVVVEDSSAHIAQTAAKADTLVLNNIGNAPEVLFQQSGNNTSSVNKGTGYQVFRMNSGATGLEWTSDIVETRDVDQTILGEKLFAEDVGLTKASEATSSDQSVESGRFRFKRAHWYNSQSNEDVLQMQFRQDSVDTNDVRLWEWVIGPPNSTTPENTDAIFLVNKEGSATVNKYLTVSGGQIRNNQGQVCITMGSSASVDIGGDLKIGGNDIKASDGTTAITLSGNDVTIADQLTVTGNLVVSGTTTTINTANLVVEDKRINLASPDGSTGTSTTGDLAGLVIETSVTEAENPTLVWKKSFSDSFYQAGWAIEKANGQRQNVGDEALPIVTMNYSNTTPTNESVSGIGGFWFEPDDKDLFIRVD
jgi:hypothetical protein